MSIEENAEEKCKYCGESIKKDTLKCPHCSEWVRANIKLEILMFLLFIFVIFFVFYYSYNNKFNIFFDKIYQNKVKSYLIFFTNNLNFIVSILLIVVLCYIIDYSYINNELGKLTKKGINKIGELIMKPFYKVILSIFNRFIKDLKWLIGVVLIGGIGFFYNHNQLLLNKTQTNIGKANLYEQYHIRYSISAIGNNTFKTTNKQDSMKIAISNKGDNPIYLRGKENNEIFNCDIKKNIKQKEANLEINLVDNGKNQIIKNNLLYFDLNLNLITGTNENKIHTGIVNISLNCEFIGDEFSSESINKPLMSSDNLTIYYKYDGAGLSGNNILGVYATKYDLKNRIGKIRDSIDKGVNYKSMASNLSSFMKKRKSLHNNAIVFYNEEKQFNDYDFNLLCNHIQTGFNYIKGCKKKRLNNKNLEDFYFLGNNCINDCDDNDLHMYFKKLDNKYNKFSYQLLNVKDNKDIIDLMFIVPSEKK